NDRSSAEITPSVLLMFSEEARRRIKAQDGSFRRHHLQALVQRVEVGMDEIRIKGSKIQLLRELVGSDGKRGVETSGPEVRIFVPKWLPGPDSNQRPTG